MSRLVVERIVVVGAAASVRGVRGVVARVGVAVVGVVLLVGGCAPVAAVASPTVGAPPTVETPSSVYRGGVHSTASSAAVDEPVYKGASASVSRGGGSVYNLPMDYDRQIVVAVGVLLVVGLVSVVLWSRGR